MASKLVSKTYDSGAFDAGAFATVDVDKAPNAFDVGAFDWGFADAPMVLVFADAAATDASLLFTKGVYITTPDATISATIQAGDGAFTSKVVEGYQVSAAIDAGEVVFTSELVYSTQTARPMIARAVVRYQDTAPLAESISSTWQDAGQANAYQAARYQAAAPIEAASHIRYQEADRGQRIVTQARYQDGQARRTAAASRFQDATRSPNRQAMRYQVAQSISCSIVQRFQDGVRNPDALHRSRYQDATPLGARIASRVGSGLHVRRGWVSRYQEGWVPRPAAHAPVVVAPVDPCYIPSAELVFSVPYTFGLQGGFASEAFDTNAFFYSYQEGEAALVFACDRHTTTPVDPSGPGATVVVPIRRVYVVENHISLQRVDTGDSIEADAFSMSLDADSWTWSWSATLAASALALIEPGPDGDPVDLEATINGVAFRLCAESYSRERSFAKARVQVQGRGRAAILDAPYAPVVSHSSAAALTAQQLAALALTVNGVTLGWDVDWGLDDWGVPGGSWSFQGSYVNAVQDIAQSAGGYVQPHRTDATLRVLKRYPAAPWDWAGLTPDFELPSAIASVEGIQWQSRPAYERIFVSGTTAGGVLGQVTRLGTAGSLVAPMVTHALMTNAIAVRQRGIAELSNTGRQALVTLRTPVLAETGIIEPGALVRYVDGADARLGYVRSTAISWERPVLRQTISIETHVP